MAQHDYNIANQSGADFRADLNNALLAIATVNSGATEPSTTFAHQLWVDTSSSVLKIRNAADNAWITTGVSITASNTFTGNLTGNVTGNLTGNVTGNVTGDLTGNADSADILSTARTISLSGDVVGSASFDGSSNIDIDTVVQINSITLGTDTTGDYVESMSGGTGVTVTGGTGEGSTPSIAIGQAVATTDDVTFNTITATDQFIGDIRGAVRFNAKADGALSKGDVVYISGVSGDVATVGQAKADDASKMPAFGFAAEDANDNAAVEVVTFGTLAGLDTSGVSEGQVLYVSTTAGEYTTTKPTGESALLQNIGKVQRSHATEGSIKVGGAGRSNATPNLNDGNIFIGNASNQAVTATLDTSIVVENTNLYYTTTRANTDFDTRLATKDTGDLTEGSNLYYTTARVNSDFDTRLATKSTTDLAEGTNLYYTSARFDSAFTSKDTDDLSEGTTNLYYTTARFDSAFGNKTTSDLTEGTNLYYTDTRANSAIDTRVTKAFVDALGIQASSVDANSVTLGTDTVGNYVATVTGTANKITVTGSGSESANITLTLPDDVQIADSLTVAGNLTVNGTLTSLDTTNLDIEDNLFQLNAGLTGSPVNDSGMLINRGDQDNGIFMWDESVDKFTLGLTTADGTATGNITLNSLGTLVANLEGAVTGNVTGTVSSLSNHDTGDLAEGSNLYYTQARFDSAFTAKSTSDLSEGSNLYYTDARFDTRLATKDTDDVSEGTSNLYYTTARFDSAFGGKSTSDLSEGSNLYYTDARVQAVSINNVVEDTTPQLGGNLDLNSSDITGTGDINITGTITSSGNITGTLATAAQPNITSLGTLTGLTTTGNLVIGTEDNNAAILEINGNATGSSEGGEIRLDTAADYDGTYEFYRLDVSEDDFRIGRQGQTDFTLFSDGTAQFHGNLTATLATAAQPNITSVGTLTGLTTTGDINFGDNDKAVFGAGSDLQIYHDGFHSNIKETGAGSLIIDAANTIFRNADATKSYAIMTDGGSVELYYNNSSKLTTTSTGIDVTGTVTADGLTVDGDIRVNTTGTPSTSGVNLVLADTSNASAIQLHNNLGGSDGGTLLYSSSASDFNVYNYVGAVGSETYVNRFGILSNGDISFYEDTGTTAKLFWDASAESLGIGTTSPAQKLDVNGTAVVNQLNINSASYDNRQLGMDGTGFFIYNSTDARYDMVISDTGNVGINNINPDEKLHISGGGIKVDGEATIASGSGTGLFLDYAGNVGRITALDQGVAWRELRLNASQQTFYIAGGEKMRIDSSGNVNIGGTGLAYKLGIFVSNSGTPQNAFTSTNNANADYFIKHSTDLTTTGTSSGALAINTAGSERMRIDSSGSIGLNTTSLGTEATLYIGKLSGASNAEGGQLVLQSSTDGSLAPHLDAYTNASVDFLRLLKGTDTASSAVHSVFDLTNNGVGIGQSVPYAHSSFSSLSLGGESSKGGLIQIKHSDNSAKGYLYAQGDAITLESVSTNIIRFVTNAAERARLDTSGNLLVGATAQLSASKVLSSFNGATHNGYVAKTTYAGTGSNFAVFLNSGNQVAGSINHNGTTSVAYNTSSDARLKDVTGSARGLEVINALNPVAYNWKADGKADEGLIAQEVLDIVPNAVSGSEEEMYQMDYSKLVVHLVKAVKEQQAQIEALQSEINKLKNS